MKTLSTVLRALGYIWIAAVGVVIFLSMIAFVSQASGFFDAWDRFIDFYSPWHIAQWALIVCALAPGVILIRVADRIASRQTNP